MAGRPRTMRKRVSRILERQEKLAGELRELMPKQYLPGPGEGWDYPDNLEEWGDDLMRSWRKAVLEIGWPSMYLEDLVILLEQKVEKIEQKASRWPSGAQASASSHGHGDAAVFRQLSSVTATFLLSASHTSTRDWPSNLTTVSSGAVIIPTRLPSCVTANSWT